MTDYTGDERLKQSDMHHMLEQLIAGQASQLKYAEERSESLKAYIKEELNKHEAMYHPDTAPHNHEVMMRGASFFGRMDGVWDGIFKAIGITALLAFGWGVVFLVSKNGAGL